MKRAHPKPKGAMMFKYVAHVKGGGLVSKYSVHKLLVFGRCSQSMRAYTCMY